MTRTGPPIWTKRLVDCLKQLLIIASVLLMFDRTVDAAGVEYVQQAWSLRVAFDSRWCGCGAGGYYPIRVRITNLGPPRELTLFVNRNARYGARVERRIKLDQNETQFCSLSLPIVGDENLVSFSILEKGELLPDFHRDFNIQRNDSIRPSLLVVDRDVVSRTAFENGANVFSTMNTATSPYSGYRAGRSEDSETVTPSMLPDRWIDYSGLDILATSFATFRSLPASNQNAILNWIETGGNLILYELPEEQSEIDRVLQVNERTFAAEGWIPTDEVFNDDKRNQIDSSTAIKSTSMVSAVEQTWSSTGSKIQHRNLVLGQVHLFSKNPFPGSTVDWACWIDVTGLNRLGWTRRVGIASGAGQQDFYEFLVPNVGDVPIYAFLCIVTLFAFFIGPVNYWYFLRRKQLQLLLLTTPLIAIITCTMLFAYAAVSDGFGVRSRTTSLTFLDQRTESAVVLQRFCLFAGLAPFDGLRFSNDTTIFPIHSPNDSSGSYSVDQTQGQHLTSGWLPSRTMSQFELITRRKERARVEVSRTSNENEMQFASGLPWNIKYLMVVDENGLKYFGENIKAGDTVKLQIATMDDVNRLHDAGYSARPEAPVGIPETWSRRRRYYYAQPQDTGPFVSKAQRERILSSFYVLGSTKHTVPVIDSRHYLAILSDKPGLEQGLNCAPSDKDLNVLIGDY